MPKISIITEAEGLDSWLESEAKTEEIDRFITFGTFPAAGYVVVADSEEIASYAFEKIDFTTPVVWFGYGYEDAADRGAQGYPFDEDDVIDADKVYTASKKLIDLLQSGSAEVAVTSSPKPKVVFPQRQSKKPTLIAVGGFAGCGSSFVAWNLANILETALLEGRVTGSLYTWIRDSTTLVDAVTTGHHFGLVSDGQQQDIQSLITGDITAVIDVGNDSSNPFWTSASTKIWVTTLDPHCSQVPDDADKIVLNRFPDGWPADPSEGLGREPDLIIRESGREVFLSCLQGQAWINKQSDETKSSWKRIIASTLGGRAATSREEGETWV